MPAKSTHYDIAVIGAGFSGSLLAAILAKHGRRVALVDPTPPPRFAIGESSTPLADLLLERIADRWSLPQLRPLARYGSWKRDVSHLTCGPKRGFSYFHHEKGKPFEDDGLHRNCMLVAASPTLELADTHWLRSDVDTLLYQQAVGSGAVFFHSAVGHIESAPDGWRLALLDHPASTAEPSDVRYLTAQFVVDAAGLGANVRSQAWGYDDRRANLQTESWAKYGHFANVRSWDGDLQSNGIDIADFPFPADQAAQHHLLEDGWIWMLRFDNGVTSVGRVFRGAQSDAQVDPHASMAEQLGVTEYPDVAALLSDAELVNPPGRLVTTNRLQRYVLPVAGPNFAVLPTAVATVDPLHSTGLAHGMSGVWRLSSILLEANHERERDELLRRYATAVQAEVAMVDRFVAGCYAAGSDFELFASHAMFYFCAAIATEEAIAKDRWDGVLWLADNETFCDALRHSNRLLAELRGSQQASARSSYRRWIKEALTPWNRVGLLDPSVNNMYRYTVAPK